MTDPPWRNYVWTESLRLHVGNLTFYITKGLKYVDKQAISYRFSARVRRCTALRTQKNAHKNCIFNMQADSFLDQ